MLEPIITSKTRIKLILKFFLNSEIKSYLRELEKDFNESSNAIRVELNRFEEAGLLQSEFIGKRKFFKANTGHPLYGDLNNILKKFVGIDQIVERITSRIGTLEMAFITGDLALGKNSEIIDLLLIGKDIDTDYIQSLIVKAEKFMKRKIHYLILSSNQLDDFFKAKPVLLIWKAEN